MKIPDVVKREALRLSLIALFATVGYLAIIICGFETCVLAVWACWLAERIVR